MSKFQEELDWYWGKRVYIYPFKSPIEDFKWLSWRNVKDTEYEERLHSYYNEEAIGLNIVTGKKGICGIGIRRDTNNRHSLAILQESLELLGLPKDYLWVLKTPHEYIIIVDVQLGFDKQELKNFQNVRIIWEKPLQLPVKVESSYPVQFNSDFYPNEHPRSVSKETIYKCINIIKDKVFAEDIKPWWKKLFGM